MEAPSNDLRKIRNADMMEKAQILADEEIIRLNPCKSVKSVQSVFHVEAVAE